MTRRHWLVTAPAWAGLMAAACSAQPPPMVAPAPAPATGSRLARVWFLREGNAVAPDSGDGPMLFANGEPLGRSPPATAFFHDFRPGRYRFSVGLAGASGAAVAFQLAPGMESYLLVRIVPAGAAAGMGGNGAFALSALAPRTAKQALPSLANLGQR